ncbi:rod shape-determining protein MreC [Tuberibacillus calidus]|jgi:rod shape-determining protein MreC|uniref:rod shape-determining protein MreC n=1 Tax=Tuberibacillus calidus TaxID=340097 RepID=UPI0003F9E9E3|nr:rod shape-determining protein MreC [Tuberibacillus calidus]
MPGFFNKKLIILLTSLILLVALIGFSLKERTKLSWPEQFVHDTVGWFQFVFNKPAQYAAGLFENIEEIRNVYKENKKLKAELRDYAELHAKYYDLKSKYENLEKQLHVDALSASKAHIAPVIGRSFDQWNQMIIVGKGSQSGIQKGMAVLTPEGFIGRVTSVSQFTSEVTLITDPSDNNQISAFVVTKGGKKYNGMIEGYDQNKHVLLLKKLPIDAKIKKGDFVMTSRLGGVFPDDLLIGKVVSVKPDPYGLTKVCEVEPAADFNNIDYVDIIEKTSLSPNGVDTP